MGNKGRSECSSSIAACSHSAAPPSSTSACATKKARHHGAGPRAAPGAALSGACGGSCLTHTCARAGECLQFTRMRSCIWSSQQDGWWQLLSISLPGKNNQSQQVADLLSLREGRGYLSEVQPSRPIPRKFHARCAENTVGIARRAAPSSRFAHLFEDDPVQALSIT